MSSSYREAVDFLYDFVNFEHERIERYSPENITLDRPAHLLHLLGNPQEDYPSMLIAGTKGKGSVAAMCAASLRAAGLRVGLYTSPHLRSFRDRIRILTPENGDGRISQQGVVELVDELKQVAEQVPGISWYEMVTAIAFLYFMRKHIDIAVIEVGLGGRLDATNLLTPLVSVITSLSLDHTNLLGSTLAEITREKAGIIKPGVPVISATQKTEALEILSEFSASRGAPLTIIGRDWVRDDQVELVFENQHPYKWKKLLRVSKAMEDGIIPPNSEFELALAGKHQQDNALVALAALDAIHPQFPELTMLAIKRGLAEVFWPGRLQILDEGYDRPTLLLDCAHNVDSAEKLATALRHDYRYESLWLIVGITADKDITGILSTLLPLTEKVIVTASSHPRASSPDELLRRAANLGFEAVASPNVAQALFTIRQEAKPGDLICVTGSIFVVGDLLNQWDSLQSKLELIGYRQPV
jgi:dihydrofolate synthase/folylpolyglutamate synthase